MQQKENRKPYAVFVITRHGVEIGRKLQESLTGVDLFVSPKFINDAPAGSQLLSLPMDATIKETFMQYDCHIFIISVGAVVRMIAPYMKNKKVDPAVICVDDKANFAVCVLSGHVGRGNFFASKTADILSATPVITTASDVIGTLTVDILGRDLGWTLEDDDRNVTRACAAVVNECRVAFVQESGEPEWWPPDKPLPAGVEYKTSLSLVEPENYEMILIASDRGNIKETHPGHYARSVIFHPRSLVLGLGCDRGIAFGDAENGIKKVLKEHGLSIQSVKSIATIDKKGDEEAFLLLGKKYNWDLVTYTAEELDRVEGISAPSAVAEKYVGTRSVSEAACILATGSGLIVPKQKYRETAEGKNLTVAVSRIGFPLRRQEDLKV